MKLVNQKSARPTRKVAAGGIGGLVTIIAVAIVDFYAPGLGGEVGPILAGGLVALGSSVAAYFTKERA